MPILLLPQSAGSVSVQPSAASLVITGSVPAVLTPRTALPSAASLVLTGATPAVLTPRASRPSAAALTLTGAVPVVLTPRTVLPNAASLVITGAVPVVSIDGGSQATGSIGRRLFPVERPRLLPKPILVKPLPASLHLTTFAPSVSVNDDDLALLLAG